jgi:hypothetical protein
VRVRPALLPVLAALVAALAIPGQLFGVNLVLAGTLVLLAIWAAEGRTIDRSNAVFAGLALILLCLPVVRSTSWLVPLDLLGALLLISVGVAHAAGWSEIVQTMIRLAKNASRGVIYVLKPIAGSIAFKPPDLSRTVRSGLMATALLMTFGALLVSADPAFASLAKQLLVPDWDPYLIVARAITALGVLALIGSITLMSPEFGQAPKTAAQMPFVGRVSEQMSVINWKPTVLLVDLLFASFVAVQAAVLFGGRDYVLRTAGLTYAEYARQGFFQLIAVALLILAVVAAAVTSNRKDASHVAWMPVLLGFLCLFALVILASALARMNLYQETFGFTRLRLLVDLTIVWLAGLFTLLIVAGVTWRGDWLPRAVVVLSVVTVIGFNVYNPDARIAERNIDRYLSTGRIDISYLASLSADAAPQLIRLPEPLRSCTLAGMLIALKTIRSGRGTWPGIGPGTFSIHPPAAESRLTPADRRKAPSD